MNKYEVHISFVLQAPSQASNIIWRVRMKRYFLTVDWCNQGKRGIFCNKNGNALAKDGEPHNGGEIWDILDCFSIVLSPQSLEFSENELKEYNRFVPLSEFSNQYGIALKES